MTTPIEEIKSKISIEQLIGEYIPLKQAGGNFKAVCPFHQEKTPSFMVSPVKQIWHCFGCHEGGDMFSFIQKYEGVEFKEALQLLAQKTGVTLRHVAPVDNSKKQLFYAINLAAAGYYQKQLWSAEPAAAKTLEYLRGRGLQDETIKEWELGLAFDTSDALVKHLAAQSFGSDDLAESGVGLRVERGVIDRFRRRLIFPIKDSQGRVVAFTARTMARIVFGEEDSGGKYINSPQTLIYNKSQVLYGFDLAKQAIRRQDYAIIVEGNVDVIMSHQAGIKNTVAASGTALTHEHLQLLSRYTKNLMLAFDPDNAGSQAVFRGLTLAWERDLNTKVIVLAPEQDPADTIAKDPEAWKQAIKDSIGAVDFYFQQVFARVDLARADHKKQAAKKILSIIGRLSSAVERAHYIKRLSQELNIPENVLWPLLELKPAPERPEPAVIKAPPKSSSGEYLLCFLSVFGSYLQPVIDEIEPEMLSAELQDLYKKIIIYYTKEQSKDLRNIANDLTADEARLWSRLVFQAEQVYSGLEPKDQARELQQLINRIKRDYLSRRLQELTQGIRTAEREHDQVSLDSLIAEHNAINEKRKNYLD